GLGWSCLDRPCCVRAGEWCGAGRVLLACAATGRAVRGLAGWCRAAAPGRGVLAPDFAPPPAFALRLVDVRLPAGPRRAVYRLVVSARSRVVFSPRDAVLPLSAPHSAFSRGR